jgi:hypothetical protein
MPRSSEAVPNITGMTWQPLEHPGQLEELDAKELVERCRPLLRRAGLATPKAFPRHAENLALAAFELAAKWDRDPTLDGRRVGFGEFFATRLANQLRELDRQQQPELYDSSKRYLPENTAHALEAVAMEARELEVRRNALHPVDDPAELLAEVAEGTPEERLSSAAMQAGIDVASQPGAFALAAGAYNKRFEKDAGRRAAKALGHDGAATAPLLEAIEYAEDLRQRGEQFPAQPGSSFFFMRRPV